ncbi:5-formyltetrahydrofolate cyclo-ligase [Methylocapsa sp. S129]|uniref:5-formyltetrahydrofolate cyclo-ligase n=1 Tax=Methylocapsa sp. S129 TaxID=1641869 RepID=UPI00131CD35F|nr:5-formyltetrahydrofolate cyclo-ligase [Methylocapsa sp. S129]
MPTAPAARKDSLRQQALQRRRALDSKVRESFSARLAEEGLAIARRIGARAVSAFFPIRGEPDTLPLLAALAAHGFCTGLPTTVSRAAPLVFRQWRPGDLTIPGAMKVPEPLASAKALDPDLLFVPLACFDRRGHRIGYGAGHYDRTLAALRAAGPVTAVGVAYDAAQAPAIPDEPHDQRLDFILTERELIDCRDG